MSTQYKPIDAEQVREAVAWCVAEETPLEVLGAGSKRTLGRPLQAEITLDLSGLTGIVTHEPSELVLTAHAGTPLAEIDAALAEASQALAFEPPDLGPLLGAEAGRATLGGIVACNLSGPRRFKAGAARDHLLGFAAVNGRGEAFKAGGKVVKNVTGYDLCKLMAGSYGTLAVMTELTVKVLPRADKVRTVLAYGLDDAAAIALLGDMARSTLEPTGLAHLPPAAAAHLDIAHVDAASGAVTAVRIEGPAASAEARCRELRARLEQSAKTEELHGRNSHAFWKAVGDAAPFHDGGLGSVWRLSVPPASAVVVTSAIANTLPAAVWFYDWAGGLIWLAAPTDRGDGGAGPIRDALANCGGHATLIRGTPGLRAAIPVFHPQPEALAALTARVKQAFDPRGVLNPGRMIANL